MAVKIIKDVDGHNIDISSLNLANFKSECDAAYVPQSRTIADLALTANISKAALASSLTPAMFTVTEDTNYNYYKTAGNKAIKVDYSTRDGDGNVITATYATQDGTYPDMSVGNAEYAYTSTNLITDRKIEYTTTFQFSFTGLNEQGEGSDIDSGVADLISLYGNSVQFRQLMSHTPATGTDVFKTLYPSSHPEYWTRTTDGDAAIWTKNDTLNRGEFEFSVKKYTNHIYLALIGITPLVGDKFILSTSHSLGESLAGNIQAYGRTTEYELNVKYDLWDVIKATSDNQYGNFYFYIQNKNAIGAYSLKLHYCNVFDLTIMFGEGNEPQDIEEFKARFPKEYYTTYNTLVSAQPTEFISRNRNQFEGLNQNILVCPGTTYSIEGITTGTIQVYDINNNQILSTSISSLPVDELTGISYIDMPENAHAAKINATAYTDICFYLKWDSSETGYVAANPQVINFPSVELNRVGNIKDELTPDGKFIQRVGKLDMGNDLTWSYDSTEARKIFIAEGTFASTYGGSNTVGVLPTLACLNYATHVNTSEWLASTVKSGTIFLRAGTNRLCIRDELFSGSVSSLQNSLKGVYLLYELAEPIIHDVTEWDGQFDVDDYGTLEFVDNREVTVVPENTISYYPGLTGFLDSIYMEMQGVADFNRRFDEKLTIGTYSPITSVGFADVADQLRTGLGFEDTKSFKYQIAGGAIDSEVGSNSSLKVLKGNTYILNQLIDVYATSEIQGVTVTKINKNTLKFNGTCTQYVHSYISSNVASTRGHMYLFDMKILSGSIVSNAEGYHYANGESYEINFQHGNGWAIFPRRTGRCTYVSGTDLQLGTHVEAGTVYNNAVIQFNAYDLTQMFGNGNEPTYDEFVNMFPKATYEKNLGELKFTKPDKYIAVARNQFNGAFELGSLSSEGAVEDDYSIRSTDYIHIVSGLEEPYRLELFNLPAGSYSVSIFYYDADKNYLDSEEVQDNPTDIDIDFGGVQPLYAALPLLSETKYIKFVVTYSNYEFSFVPNNLHACLYIHYDNTEDRNYVDYLKAEYSLPQVELHRAGSIYDELYQSGEGIKRVGIKTLTQDYAVGDTITISDMKPNSLNITSKYGDIHTIYSDANRTYDFTNWGDVTNATITLTKALSADDVILYELNTPTTLEDEGIFSWSADMLLNNWGTQEFDSLDNLPINCTFKYEAQLKDFLEVLYQENGGVASKFMVDDGTVYLTETVLSTELSVESSTEIVAGALYKTLVAGGDGLTIRDLRDKTCTLTFTLGSQGTPYIKIYPAAIVQGGYSQPDKFQVISTEDLSSAVVTSIRII